MVVCESLWTATFFLLVERGEHEYLINMQLKYEGGGEETEVRSRSTFSIYKDIRRPECIMYHCQVGTCSSSEPDFVSVTRGMLVYTCIK